MFIRECEIITSHFNNKSSKVKLTVTRWYVGGIYTIIHLTWKRKKQIKQKAKTYISTLKVNKTIYKPGDWLLYMITKT